MFFLLLLIMSMESFMPNGESSMIQNSLICGRDCLKSISEIFFFMKFGIFLITNLFSKRIFLSLEYSMQSTSVISNELVLFRSG